LPLDAGSAAMAEWNREHPNNFWGLLGEGRALLAERKFKEAKAQLERAVKLYPTYGEAGGPYLLLAAAERELGNAAGERAMLEKHAALDADGVEPRLRLVEVAAAAGDWPAVRTFTEQVLAVNPLIPPRTATGAAAEAAGDRSAAIAARRTLLALDPLDKAGPPLPPRQLLADDGHAEARRQSCGLERPRGTARRTACCWRLRKDRAPDAARDARAVHKAAVAPPPRRGRTASRTLPEAKAQ
jgi:tetratricopeptide (TPR) repeat protein